MHLGAYYPVLVRMYVQDDCKEALQQSETSPVLDIVSPCDTLHDVRHSLVADHFTLDDMQAV